MGVSSLVDTWLLLRNVETNGERNRLLFVLKSRGTAHSNQVREFLLTGHGIELVDVYVGAAGCWPARPGWPSRPPSATRGFCGPRTWAIAGVSCAAAIYEREADLAALRTSSPPTGPSSSGSTYASAPGSDAEADRLAMATQRGADAAPGNGEQR